MIYPELRTLEVNSELTSDGCVSNEIWTAARPSELIASGNMRSVRGGRAWLNLLRVAPPETLGWVVGLLLLRGPHEALPAGPAGQRPVAESLRACGCRSRGHGPLSGGMVGRWLE